MDIATIIGVAGCLVLLAMGVFTSGGALITYWDLPSFLIVFVGSWVGLFTFSSIPIAIGVFKTIGLTFKVPKLDTTGIIQKLMSFSEKARREGLLALEDELEDLDNQFMKKGMRLVVDGTDASIIRILMENEMTQTQGRHADKIGALGMWATLAPGLGMLGTVLGLIAMLKNLEDKSALGPNMAVALITTLYGSMVANIFMIPWMGKLKTQDATEATFQEMILEGILSIQAGDNPRILATKLLSYVNPAERKALEAEIMKD
ncbi:MAG: motility protein A [Treponematales bacterium]|jgi:chemotaxis protein MotA